MDLREKLDHEASTHCPSGGDPCNFCKRDRGNAYRFARLALEHLIIKHVKIINGQHGPIESINPEAVRNLLADLSTEGGRHG